MCRFVPVHPGLEALQDGFYMVGPEWNIVYWNAAAARLFGRSADAALGRELWDVLPHLSISPSRERLHEVMETHTAQEYLEPYVHAGETGYFRVRVSRVETGSIAVHLRDVTDELKLAERYSGLLESIRDGFVAVDGEGRILHLNGVAESLLRLPRERAVGLQLWGLLPSAPKEIEQSLRDTMTDAIQRHLREIRPEGRVFRGRVFDLWIYPLPDGGVSLLFEDVSERVQREKELARLASEANEANRAKSRFFAAVSHELRTPLNAVVGYTHLLSTEAYGPMTGGAIRAADRAGVCAEHLARLIDDVLLMTTAEIGRLPVVPVPLSLPGFLEESVAPVRHQAEAKGLRFVLDTPPHLPPVETDPDRLRQVLHALLSNAVKFTSRGEVRVEARCVDSASVSGDPWVELTVSDTGPGIRREDRERIFDAFEQLGDQARTDSINRGTGLGLTVARQLTRLLHGHLAVDDAPIGGTQFRLRLQRSFPSARDA